MDGIRRRFWLEVVTAAGSSAVLLVTLLASDWIERVFGIAPDRHSGAAEWAIVAFALAAAIVASALARGELRRARAAAAAAS